MQDLDSTSDFHKKIPVMKMGQVEADLNSAFGFGGSEKVIGSCKGLVVQTGLIEPKISLVYVFDFFNKSLVLEKVPGLSNSFEWHFCWFWVA